MAWIITAAAAVLISLILAWHGEWQVAACILIVFILASRNR